MNKTAIFIDAGHLHYQLYNKWKIDYKKLKDHFIQKGYLPIYIFYYEGMMTQLSYFSKNPSSTINDFNEAKKAKKNILMFLDLSGLLFNRNLFIVYMTMRRENIDSNAILM